MVVLVSSCSSINAIQKKGDVVNIKMTMKQDLFDNAYDIGEGMAVLREQGASYTLVNKETGKLRQLVDGSGHLLVGDDEIDLGAMRRGCPHYHGNKSVRYWFGRYDDFKNGVCAISWTVYPDGRYFEDEDGFGGEDNPEERAYCVINRDLEIIVPFQPMEDVRIVLMRYEKKRVGWAGVSSSCCQCLFGYVCGSYDDMCVEVAIHIHNPTH